VISLDEPPAVPPGQHPGNPFPPLLRRFASPGNTVPLSVITRAVPEAR
jgi:hypothetical protein